MSSDSDSSTIRLAPDVQPPDSLKVEGYALRPLTIEHTERDYQAVMETAQRLRASAPNGWPRPGFTLEENHEDLRRHQEEFEQGLSFAYTMLSPDETEVLGCVYLNPPRKSADDVDVHMWVRERIWSQGMAQLLHRDVDDWLRGVWRFSAISYQRPDYYFSHGRCLCGQVAYYAGPLNTPFELCHCSRCRRASGSACVAGIMAGEVRFTAGRERVTSITLPVKENPPGYRRIFCDTCGSPVPDPDQTGPQEIAAGSLTPMPILPDRHIFVECAPEWAPVTGPLPQFTAAQIRTYRESGQ